MWFFSHGMPGFDSPIIMGPLSNNGKAMPRNNKLKKTSIIYLIKKNNDGTMYYSRNE